MARWRTTTRGRNLVKRKMTDKEREMYGFPLTGAAAFRAEMEALNEERVFSQLRWGDEEYTPSQAPQEPGVIVDTGAETNGDLLGIVDQGGWGF